jgi:hypothetical protein
MPSNHEDADPDTAWDVRPGGPPRLGEVGEDRTRGAYLNGRMAWVLGASIVAAVVVLGGALVLNGAAPSLPVAGRSAS